MRLNQPFLRLRRRFCAETLAAEVLALPPSAWVPHPGNYAGNDAVLLITPNGEMTNAFSGPMKPTEHLLRCRYIMEAMAEIGAVWGRSRLMRLAPGANVPAHIDINYYWRTHMRVHIPIVTTPNVTFTCGDETVHMKAGECWIFDSFRQHGVHNGGAERRIHLVLDTVGGEALWDLAEEAMNAPANEAPKFCPPGRKNLDGLAYEQVNAPRIMSPWEIRCHIAFAAEHVLAHPVLDRALRRLEKFAYGWTAIWARHGEREEGVPTYQRLINEVQRDLLAMGAEPIMLRNGIPFLRELSELIFYVAVPAQPALQTKPLQPPAGSPPFSSGWGRKIAS